MKTCRYCGSSTVEPKRATPRVNIITLETAKVGFLNILTSTIGCSCLSSQSTKETRQTAATMELPRMNDEANHSSSCPLSRTISSAPRPTAMRPRPM